MDKTKKRKIITGILCIVVILVGIIASIILLTQKKFDITANAEPIHNEHTTLRIAKPATGLTVEVETINNLNQQKFYSNGTVFVKNNETSKYGVYSYIDNKLIIPTDYSKNKITPIMLTNRNEDTQEYIFKVGNKSGENKDSILFYNNHGYNIGITEYSETDNKTYAYIKEKSVDIQQKRKGIKIKPNKDFECKKITIKDAQYIQSYIKDGVYNYELWKLIDAEGNNFTNLYKTCGTERELVQTLNNPIGNPSSIADDSTMFYFLSDGTPMIRTTRTEYDDDNNLYAICDTYNIDFKHKNTATVKVNETLNSYFAVGNSTFIQYIIPSTEDHYDYSDVTTTTDGTTTNYYLVETYKFNNKNGKLKEIKFKYVINGANTEFNSETALIKARKISSKTLQDEEILLVNDDLKTKKISYDIESIYKVTDDRYIVENEVGQYLIDEQYNLISYLGDYNTFFTTDEAILLKDATNTYVCSLDGIVVKKYLNSEVTNAYDDTYYIVNTEKEIDGVTHTEQYLEKLGIRQDTPIYSKAENSETYKYNNHEYVGYSNKIFSDGVSIITRVRKVNNSRYAYEFYNIDGKLLLTLDNFETPDRTLEYRHFTDNDHSLLKISTNVGGVEYYLVVDR